MNGMNGMMPGMMPGGMPGMMPNMSHGGAMANGMGGQSFMSKGSKMVTEAEDTSSQVRAPYLRPCPVHPRHCEAAAVPAVLSAPCVPSHCIMRSGCAPQQCV